MVFDTVQSFLIDSKMNCYSFFERVISCQVQNLDMILILYTTQYDFFNNYENFNYRTSALKQNRCTMYRFYDQVNIKT